MPVLGETAEAAAAMNAPPPANRVGPAWPRLEGIEALRRGLAYGTLGELCPAYDGLTEYEKATVRGWAELTLQQPLLQLFEMCPAWYANLLVHVLCAVQVAAREAQPACPP